MRTITNDFKLAVKILLSTIIGAILAFVGVIFVISLIPLMLGGAVISFLVYLLEEIWKKRETNFERIFEARKKQLEKEKLT